MENLIHFFLSYFGFSILIVFLILSCVWYAVYTNETKRLSVHYAKIVLKKYKDSRGKISVPMYEYLFFAIVANTNIHNSKQIRQIQNRILKNWFNVFSKKEIQFSSFLQEALKNKLKKSDLWFPATDKISRMYHLKKVISRNS